MAITRSSSKGFALLECVLAMGLFALLTMVLSKALALFVQQWYQHEQAWLRLRQSVHAAANVSGWLQSVHQVCAPGCGCKVIMQWLTPEEVYDAGVWLGDGERDVLHVWTCEGESLVSAWLFVAPYQGVGGADWGLYTQQGDHPRQLLVKHIDKLHLLACQDPQNQWKMSIDEDGVHFCQTMVVQLDSKRGTLWRQVLVL